MANHPDDYDPNESTPSTDLLAATDDARIRIALESIAVPASLNERIKARLRLSALVDPCLESEPANEEQRHTPSTPTTTYRQPASTSEILRRTLLATVAAALLLGFAWMAYRWRQPNERDWLVQRCHSVLGLWEQDNPANLQVDRNLGELPATVREQLTRVTLRGTRSLTEMGHTLKGTLYRLDSANGQSLLLLRLADLPAVRGLNSRFSILTTPSGGWSLAALQVNNETFVLAAECTEQQLMNYIRRPIVT